MTEKLIHTDRYTIREIHAYDGVDLDAWELIKAAVEYGFESLQLPGHLFITVLGSATFSSDDGMGFGMYQQGIQSIVVCAGNQEDLWDGDGGDGLPVTREDYLREVVTTVLHELYHYYQDVVLDDLSNPEDPAEQWAAVYVEHLMKILGPKGDMPQTNPLSGSNCTGKLP